MKLRKLVLAFAAATGCWLGLATASFAAGASAAEDSVQQAQSCLSAFLTHSQAPALSYGLAKHCAPAGTRVVKQGQGYAIAVETAGSLTPGPATSAGDPCQWHTYTLVGAGFDDWLGADFCWDYDASWVYGNPQTSCWTWLWSSYCNYRYWSEPMGQYGDGNAVEVVGHYFQNCWVVLECDQTIWMDVAYDGHYYSGAY